MRAQVGGRRRLGLPVAGICGLAALGVPRVVAHDLDLVGPVVNSILVFAPIAVWLAVVLWKRVPNPFPTLVAIGVAYGILLAATHQVLWIQSFDGAPPGLGGDLGNVLSPGGEATVVRVFAFFSSLLTGVGVGAATGAVGWLLAKVVNGPGTRQRD
jgi:hypothetical protein